MRAEHEESLPPEGYVCKLCGVAGHYIKECHLAKAPSSSKKAARADSDLNWRRRSSSPTQDSLANRRIERRHLGVSHYNDDVLTLRNAYSPSPNIIRRERVPQEANKGQIGERRSLMISTQDVRLSDDGVDDSKTIGKNSDKYSEEDERIPPRRGRNKVVRDGLGIEDALKNLIEYGTETEYLIRNIPQLTNPSVFEEPYIIDGKLLAQATRSVMQQIRDVKTQRTIHDVIAKYVCVIADTLEVKALSMILFNLCKSGKAKKKICTKIARTIMKRPSEANPQDSANIIHAFAFAVGNDQKDLIPTEINVCISELFRAALSGKGGPQLHKVNGKDIASICAAIFKLYPVESSSDEMPEVIIHWLDAVLRSMHRSVAEDAEFNTLVYLAYCLNSSTIKIGQLQYCQNNHHVTYYLGLRYDEIYQLDEGFFCMLLKSLKDEAHQAHFALFPSRFYQAIIHHAFYLVPQMQPMGLASSAISLALLRVSFSSTGRCVGLFPPELMKLYAERILFILENQERASSSTKFTHIELAIFARCIAQVPPITLSKLDHPITLSRLLGAICKEFCARVLEDSRIGCGRDAAEMSRAVALVGNDFDFVKTYWNACVLAPDCANFHPIDLCMLHQARTTFYHDKTKYNDFVQLPPNIKSKYDLAIHRLSATPSAIQMKISRILQIDWSHFDEYIVPDILLSLDMAQPETYTAVEVAGPHHFFSHPDALAGATKESIFSQLNEFVFELSDSSATCHGEAGKLSLQELLNGPTQWKLRTLRKLGWRVLVIPFTCLHHDLDRTHRACQETLRAFSFIRPSSLRSTQTIEKVHSSDLS